MTATKDAIARMHALGDAGFARTPTTQPEIQKQLHKFDQQVDTVEAVEELRPFLERSRGKGAATLRRHELNRVLRGGLVRRGFRRIRRRRRRARRPGS